MTNHFQLLSIFMLLRLFCAENVILEKVRVNSLMIYLIVVATSLFNLKFCMTNTENSDKMHNVRFEWKQTFQAWSGELMIADARKLSQYNGLIFQAIALSQLIEIFTDMEGSE